MIRTIYLENFQSHKQSSLHLSPGVNVIIGPSDSGKSAVLRAINWVINNRPLGDAMKSHWANEGVFVDVELDSGEVISREKDSKNRYVITKRNEEEIYFDAFGHGVPDEVRDLLNMKQINIQMQHDSPFLLSEGSGEIARYLNRVTNLDKIHVSLSKIAEIKRKEEQELRHKQSELENLNDAVTLFDDLSTREKKLSRLERWNRKIISEMERYVRGKTLIAKIENNRALQNKISKIFAWEKNIKDNLALCQEIASLRRKKEKAGRSIEEIKKVQGHRDLAAIRAKLDGQVETLLTETLTLNELATRKKKIDQICQALKDNERRLNMLTQAIQEKQDKFHELMPDICPLCGQTI